jgi:hypothetical protein
MGLYPATANAVGKLPDGGLRCAFRPPSVGYDLPIIVRCAMKPARLSPLAFAIASRRSNTRRGRMMFTVPISCPRGGVHRHNAKRPSPILGIGADFFEGGSRWDIPAIVQGSIDPRHGGLFSTRDRLIQRIAGGKASGKVGHDHAICGCILANFDRDRIAHEIS